jgi:hypothetical protein
MSKQHAIEALKILDEQPEDTSGRKHLAADNILCQFLREIGHGDLVDAYEEVGPKWYE